jgi:WD repeat-containing protein 1 (actin-interacting protein 1)
MPPSGPDASNSCLPPALPVVCSIPPIPSTTRGERCSLDGETGRFNASKHVLVYGSGKLVVARKLAAQDEPLLDIALPSSPSKSTPDANTKTASKLPLLVYRGHHYNVTSVKMAPSGCYMASGDERGMLRVWAFDHEEHLCKYDKSGLTGPIRDIDWDNESKKLAFVGERNAASSDADCARIIQYDTGVTTGQLASHLKGRACAVSIKPSRPYRLVTGGKDDNRCYFHKGPPFAKIPPVDGVPTESAHTKGSVQCIRYNHAGSLAASVGSDRSLCIYDGTTFALQYKLENIHTATIYACAWSGNDQYILTAAGDGTCKAFEVASTSTPPLVEKHVWHPAQHQLGTAFDKVPVGGNQVGCAFVNGTTPVCVGLNGQLSILSPIAESSADTVVEVITGHNAPVSGLALDRTSGMVFTGDSDGIICSWSGPDLKGKRMIPPEGNGNLQFITHSGAIAGVACLKGSGALLSVGWDDKLYSSDRGSSQVSLNGVSLPAQPSGVAGGTNLALVITVQGLVLVKPSGSSFSISGSLIKLSYTALSACVSSDDKLVFVGGSDSKIHVYQVVDDASDLKEVNVVEGHLQPVSAVALSNDQTKLASADSKDICVFDVSNATVKGECRAIVGRGRWCFHVQRITCLSWSLDDSVLASGSVDNSVYLWSPQFLSKRVHYAYAHRGGITGIQFLPPSDGSYQFLSVGADSVLNKWDVTNDVKTKFV